MTKSQLTRSRIDVLLVERGYFPSREKAQRAIMAGLVHLGVGDDRATKPGMMVSADAILRVESTDRYVGRGGLKLEHALQAFDIQTDGVVALDIGASTGGFTDCLLQHGASRVYALDVGHSQLDWKIRSDSRVVVQEKVNARYLKPEDFSETIDLIVIDVSFISLTLILPAAMAIVKPNGFIIALIKPQFELGREEVSKGSGVIRDDDAHQRAIAKIRQFVLDDLHREWIGVETSPIVGAEGNKEFIACLKNPLAS